MAQRIALAGGGTAGHLFPSLAVAQRLLELSPDAELLFFAAKRQLDAELLAELNVPCRLLGARPFPYAVSLRWVGSLAALGTSLLTAWGVLRGFRPDVLFASGGYISVPCVLAARMLGVPCVVHAGDALPDRANRLLSRYAACITVAFEQAIKHFPRRKTIYTGPPIRKEILGASRAEALTHFGLDPARKTLLVTGGSQGARAINQAVSAALPQLVARDDLQIIHLTGRLDYEEMERRAQSLGLEPPVYRCIPFCRRMGLAYAAADIIVSRAGSSSLGEAIALAKPMIVVPYPHAGGHQMANARPLAEAGAAVVIENSQLSGARLTAALSSLLDDPGKLAAMAQAARRLQRPRAAEDIAQLLLEVASGLPTCRS